MPDPVDKFCEDHTGEAVRFGMPTSRNTPTDPVNYLAPHKQTVLKWIHPEIQRSIDWDRPSGKELAALGMRAVEGAGNAVARIPAEVYVGIKKAIGAGHSEWDDKLLRDPLGTLADKIRSDVEQKFGVDLGPTWEQTKREMGPAGEAGNVIGEVGVAVAGGAALARDAVVLAESGVGIVRGLLGVGAKRGGVVAEGAAEEATAGSAVARAGAKGGAPPKPEAPPGTQLEADQGFRATTPKEEPAPVVAKGECGCPPKPRTEEPVSPEGQKPTSEPKADEDAADAGKRSGVGGRQTGGQAGEFSTADEAWATKRYDEIRRDTGDVDRIADATGLRGENIQKVKQHVFEDVHIKDRFVDQGVPPEVGRFDPDPEQVRTWERLQGGRQTPDDMAWLKHEIAERKQMELSGNRSYGSAHDTVKGRWPSPLEKK